MISVMDKQNVVHFIPMLHKEYRHHIQLFTDLFNGTAGLFCEKCKEFIPMAHLRIETLRDVDEIPQ